MSAALDSNEGKFSQQREVKKVLFVAIVSNRGLAGAFNTQVFRLVRKAVARCEGRMGSRSPCCPSARRPWTPTAALA